MEEASEDGALQERHYHAWRLSDGAKGYFRLSAALSVSLGRHGLGPAQHRRRRARDRADVHRALRPAVRVMPAEILQGDARRLPLADASVHCVVTSPPYWGLRAYGGEIGMIGLEPSFDEHLANLVAVFQEVWRVLRDDGTLWLNYGDAYIGPKNLLMMPARVALALQDDGWIIRSDIIWAKPNPMPESTTDRPTSAHEHMFLLSKRPRYFYDADAVRVPLLTSTMERGRKPEGKSFMSPKGGDPSNRRESWRAKAL